MSESSCIDPPLRGFGMPKDCPVELRERPINAVEMGASRRAAAKRFDLSASSAVKCLQRWRDDGSAAAKPREGDVSPLEKFAAQILAVIAEQSDRTLLETAALLRRQRIRSSCSSLWRFFNRHNITFKKGLQAAERQRADVARARRNWIGEQGILDPAGLVFLDETVVSPNLVLGGRALRGVRLVGEVPLGSWETITFVATMCVTIR
jgi:transposase